MQWWSPFAISAQVSQASDHSTVSCNVLFLFGLGPPSLPERDVCHWEEPSTLRRDP